MDKLQILRIGTIVTPYDVKTKTLSSYISDYRYVFDEPEDDEEYTDEHLHAVGVVVNEKGNHVFIPSASSASSRHCEKEAYMFSLIILGNQLGLFEIAKEMYDKVIGEFIDNYLSAYRYNENDLLESLMNSDVEDVSFNELIAGDCFTL